MKNILILYTLILVGVGCGEKSQLSKEISLFQKSPVMYETGKKLTVNAENRLALDGEPIDKYTFQGNYYFFAATRC